MTDIQRRFDEVRWLLQRKARRFAAFDRDDLESLKWEAVWKAAQTFDARRSNFSSWACRIFETLCGDKRIILRRLSRRREAGRASGRRLARPERVEVREPLDPFDLDCLGFFARRVVDLYLEGYSLREIDRRFQQPTNWAGRTLKEAITTLRINAL